MNTIFNAKRAMIVAFGVGAALTIGVAFALWSQTGSGSGSAGSTGAQASVVTAGTATADLYPGFTGGDVTVKVTNPNPYPVEFTSMTAGTVTTTDADCLASNVTAVGKSGLSIVVPAGTTTTTAVSQTITDVVSMGINAPDGCQDATFSIGLTLTGAQKQ